MHLKVSLAMLAGIIIVIHQDSFYLPRGDKSYHQPIKKHLRTRKLLLSDDLVIKHNLNKYGLNWIKLERKILIPGQASRITVKGGYKWNIP